MKTLAATIRRKLKERADAQTKAASERYFRGVISFYGLKAPTLRALYRELSAQVHALSLADQLTLAQTLLRSHFGEEKQFAICILEASRKELSPQFLIQFEPDLQNHVFDWGTADALSGRVFRHFIERGDKSATQRIVAWRNHSSLWMQRMAAVSFVWLAQKGGVTQEVLHVCTSTVRNKERFTQLGTGWVLRELWLAEPARVESFLTKNYAFFSREGLRYATEKMPAKKRAYFLESNNFLQG